MGVSKLIVNGVTRFDITSDTVDSASLLSGKTAHDKAGEAVTGSIAAMTTQQIHDAVNAGWNGTS